MINCQFFDFPLILMSNKNGFKQFQMLTSRSLSLRSSVSCTGQTILKKLRCKEKNFVREMNERREMKRNPPSVWPGVPLSQIPTTSAPKRTSKRALNAV